MITRTSVRTYGFMGTYSPLLDPQLDRGDYDPDEPARAEEPLPPLAEPVKGWGLPADYVEPVTDPDADLPF